MAKGKDVDCHTATRAWGKKYSTGRGPGRHAGGGMGELSPAETMAFWVTAGGGDRVRGADILGNNLPGGGDGCRQGPEANFAFRAATGQEERNGRCS